MAPQFMSMIKIVTKKGCSFCEILKAQLDNFGVPYEEELVKSGTVPIMKYADSDKVIFRGLPKRKELVKFLEELKNA